MTGQIFGAESLKERKMAISSSFAIAFFLRKAQEVVLEATLRLLWPEIGQPFELITMTDDLD